MKKLDTSSVAGTTGLPIKSGTLQHLQAAYIEDFQDIIKGILGLDIASSTPYVLQGCIRSSSTSTFSVTAGIIYYQGEIFRVPATASHTYSGVPVVTLTTAFFTAANADPVLFTDLVNRSVHQIRTMVISDGTSGTTTFDYADLNFNHSIAWVDDLLVAADVTPAAGTYTITAGSIISYKIEANVMFVQVFFLATGSSTTNTSFGMAVPAGRVTRFTFDAVGSVSGAAINEALRVNISAGVISFSRFNGSAFPSLAAGGNFYVSLTIPIV